MTNGYDLQSVIGMYEETMGMSLFASFVSELPSMLIGLAVYVFTALSLYTIAKRRGIHHPWLAWIPFANSWLLGCIADQYRFVTRGEVKYRRRWLLFTEIATSVMSAVCLVLCFVMLFNVLTVGLSAMGLSITDLANPEVLESLEIEMSEADSLKLMSAIMGPVMGMVLLALTLLPVAILHAVFSFIALHDIYKSSDPSNATLYLLLSIFIGYAQPIILFICRNKDFGMPIRVNPQPTYVPYQQNEPDREPWEQQEQ